MSHGVSHHQSGNDLAENDYCYLGLTSGSLWVHLLLTNRSHKCESIHGASK